MIDLIDRLRAERKNLGRGNPFQFGARLCIEAADEIERLRAALQGAKLARTGKHADTYAVACPYCKAPQLSHCWRKNRAGEPIWTPPHHGRVKVARERT